MKKYLLLPVFLFLSLVITSCDDENTTEPVDNPGKGSVYITSSPAGAAIWEGSTNTNKVTPDSVTGLTPGTHNFTLKLPDYRDTTIAVNIVAGQRSNVTILMSSSANLTYFSNPIRIYETVGTSATQPSGLDLSAGTALGIGSGSAGRADVDLFYSSTGYVLASASQATGLTRQTFFKIGSGTNLNDHVPAPTKDATWTLQVQDTETNYIFVYDNDKHYSKIKFTRGGGTGIGDPAYVDITWIYNNTVDDKRF